MESTNRLSRHMEAAVAIIKKQIDLHPLETKSIHQYSEIAAINRKLLQKAFKQKFGINIKDYELKKRMEEAASMLEEGRLSNKQIACRCGYTSANNFSRAFKKVYNIPPKEWKNGYAAEIALEDIKED
jgi:two-component system response regulator YesN